MRLGKTNTLLYGFKFVNLKWSFLFILLGLLCQIPNPAQSATPTPTPKPIQKSQPHAFPPIIIIDPIVLFSPTPTPKKILIDPFPTLIIKLPTPLPTATPTPVFDLAAAGVTLSTTAIVYSLPNLDKIKGQYQISVVSAPTTDLPALINYELLNSANTITANWVESVTLTDNLGHTTFSYTQPYSFPFSATQTLPLDTYKMQIRVEVDPARADLIPGGTIPIEPNTANNVFQSLGAKIAQLSGTVHFGDITTTITSINAYNFLPLTFSGKALWNTDIPFSFSNIIGSRDDTTLDVIVTGGAAAFVPPSTPYKPGSGDWSYLYQNGILNAGGAFANLFLPLPNDIGYRDNEFRLTFSQKPLGLGSQKLTQSVSLAAATIDLATASIWMSQGTPVQILSASQTFSPAAGLTLHGRVPIYQYLFHFSTAYGPGERPSNDGYFQDTLQFESDPLITVNGLQAVLDLKPGDYQSSFPVRNQVTHGSGKVVFQDGKVVYGASEMDISQVQLVLQTSSCQFAPKNLNPVLNTTAKISGDGALTADHDLSTPLVPEFNTYKFSPIDHIHWYQPGYRLPLVKASDFGSNPSEYLQAMRSLTDEQIFSYGDKPFSLGSDLFAGINILPDEFNGQPFKTNIDANPTNPVEFTSTEWTKVYLRASGYSGVVDAVGQTAGLEIYPDPACGNHGYDVTLTAFGQAYLDNDSKGFDTTTKGKIDIPWPSSITIPFEEMTLNGCGNLTDGKVPADAKNETRTLSYWSADLRLLTLAFDKRKGAVNDNERTLWISSKNPVAHLEDEPTMQINLLPCGTIGDSRIETALATQYDGYNATIQKVYLSKFDGNPNVPNGFYSLVGELTVSFFNPPKIHAIVKGSVGRLANGQPWFDMAEPDPDHDGFPTGYASAITPIDAKINDYTNKRLVEVKTIFANIVNLAYKVEYNPTKKEFKSAGSLQQDLIVMDIKSSVDYLNAQRTQISFGVEVTGIPNLNLSSAAGQFSSQIQNTFLGPVRDKLEQVSDKLTGDLTTIIRPQVRQYLNPLVTQYLNQLKSQIQGMNPAQLQAFITNVSFQNQLNTLVANLQLFNYLHNASMPAVDVINQILTTLDQVLDVLKFSPQDLTGKLGPLVEGVLDAALAVLGESIGYDLNQLLAKVDKSRQEIVAFIENEIIPKLDQAKSVFNNPVAYLNTFFPPLGISNLENDIKAQLTNILYQTAVQHYDQFMAIQPNQITDYILNSIFNSSMFQQLNTAVTNVCFPVKNALLDQAQAVLDSINDAVTDFLKEQAGILDGALADIKGTLGFKGAELKGYAVISGNIMEKLHIDGSFTINIPNEVTYSAYLDMTRYQTKNSGKNCYAALNGEDVMDTRIGATDVGLEWPGADLKAKIEFAIMISGGAVVNVGGSIQCKGTVGFESAVIFDPGFGVAIGKVENYVWAHVGVRFEGYSLSGGVFFGTSCTLDPLKALDPDVASLLNITEMRGIYLSVAGSFPIINFGCALRVAAEAGVAMWYFADGPTFGGRLDAGAYGEAACIVSVKGHLTLIGGKDSGGYFFKGNAWVGGGIGFCDPEDWHSAADVLDDDWCASCVATFSIIYKNDWDVDYDVDCSL